MTWVLRGAWVVRGLNLRKAFLSRGVSVSQGMGGAWRQANQEGDLEQRVPQWAETGDAWKMWRRKCLERKDGSGKASCSDVGADGQSWTVCHLF